MLGLLGFFLSPVGRYLSVLAIGAMLFFAGDMRGRRIEHAKCEAAAEAARRAADAQDAQANKDVQQSNDETIATLNKQKEEADARAADLEKRLQDTKSQCVYGPDEQPAPFGMRNGSNSGANDPKYPGATRVPTTRVGPSGEPR